MLFLPKFTSGWTLVEKSPISEVHIQKLVFLLFLYGTYQHGPAEFSAKKMAGQLYVWKWLDKISPNDLNNSKIIFRFQSFSLLTNPIEHVCEKITMKGSSIAVEYGWARLERQTLKRCIHHDAVQSGIQEVIGKNQVNIFQLNFFCRNVE